MKGQIGGEKREERVWGGKKGKGQGGSVKEFRRVSINDE